MSNSEDNVDPKIDTTEPRRRPRRPTLLNRKAHVASVKSYRAMSPSRFLDYPLAVNPAIYSYARVRRDRVRDARKGNAPTQGTTAGANAGESECSDIDSDLELDRPRPTSLAAQTGVVPDLSTATPYESAAGKERVDYLLDAVAQLYYRRRTGDSVRVAAAQTEQEQDLFGYPTLELLLSPLRRPHALDGWSPRDLVLFEAGLASMGKDFHLLQQLFPHKATNEVVDLYYAWKHSAHGAVWRSFGKQSRRLPTQKLAHWAQMDAKMRGASEPLERLIPELPDGRADEAAAAAAEAEDAARAAALAEEDAAPVVMATRSRRRAVSGEAAAAEDVKEEEEGGAAGAAAAAAAAGDSVAAGDIKAEPAAEETEAADKPAPAPAPAPVPAETGIKVEEAPVPVPAPAPAPASEQPGPQPGQSEPALPAEPVGAVPAPVEVVPAPVEAVPAPVEAVPAPVEAAPMIDEAVPTPAPASVGDGDGEGDEEERAAKRRKIE